VFNLLPRGAYPQAGLQLIDALRDYEQMLEQGPPREDSRYSFRRNRSEFSWQQLLSEFCDDPLKSPFLQRQNWAKIRPDLYVSTHITERDNFVIDVRPTIGTGFRYGGASYYEDSGDFRRFPGGASGWSRPSNRMLYVNLGDLAHSFQSNAPWVNHRHPGEQHAPERQLLLLVTRAKLHQLSLHFNCYLSRELVEFGPEHYLDFREARGDGDSRHRNTHFGSMQTFNHINPDRWVPSAINEHLAKSSLDVATLYRFATEYLVTLDKKDQARVYAEYLAARPALPLTQSDVEELLRCATDRNYRAEGLLAALAVDSTICRRMKEHGMFSYFCRNFGFTEQAGLAWIGQYHPTALVNLGHVSLVSLIDYLRTLDRIVDAAALAKVDELMAAKLAADDSFKWVGAAALPGRLDTEARGYGFPSFETFQLWAKNLLPRAWAAGAARAERLTEHVAECEAEALAKREAANAKRKATRAARKAEKATEKTA
jgi:hypothetical protein